jgi:hypothetical protein
MIELKKKALGGIKGMLEDRLSNRLKPKAEPQESREEDLPVDGDELPESDESPEGLEVPEGADISRLAPEEQQQLKDLYTKMGC